MVRAKATTQDSFIMVPVIQWGLDVVTTSCAQDCEDSLLVSQDLDVLERFLTRKMTDDRRVIWKSLSIIHE